MNKYIRYNGVNKNNNYDDNNKDNVNVDDV